MSFVRYEIHGNVAEILLDHAPLNTLTETMVDELLAALQSAANDEDVRAVILGSAVPRTFCAGLDLVALVGSAGARVQSLLDKLYVHLYEAQFHLGKPSLAVVAGAARGGGMTIAISCNMIIAGRSATFGYPEINVGVVPAIHYAHLPRVIGRYRAFDLLFTGRSFGADEAAALGLVSRVVDDAAVHDEAQRAASVLASKPPEAVKFGRAIFMHENDAGLRESIAAAARNFCTVVSREEAHEGIRAFLEKRPPRWQQHED
jgi:enoyl-CoA hydratase/carnithine racemase